MKKTNYYPTCENEVREYFKSKNAYLNINPSYLSYEELLGIYEYLWLLIQDGSLEIPGFTLQGYTCQCYSCQPNSYAPFIHNFWFKLTGTAPNLDNQALLQQEGSQPKPFYTLYGYNLYITIIAEV